MILPGWLLMVLGPRRAGSHGRRSARAAVAAVLMGGPVLADRVSPVADISDLKVGARVTYNARTGTNYALRSCHGRTGTVVAINPAHLTSRSRSPSTTSWRGAAPCHPDELTKDLPHTPQPQRRHRLPGRRGPRAIAPLPRRTEGGARRIIPGALATLGAMVLWVGIDAPGPGRRHAVRVHPQRLDL